MKYIREGVILFTGLALVAVPSAQNQCYTPNNYPGECISLYQCTGLLNFIESRRATSLTWTERELITQSQCFSNTSGQHPHVCCNNDDPFVKTQPTTLRPYVNQVQLSSGGGNLLPNPAVMQCGRGILSSRLYYEHKTILGEFPWLVLLEYQNTMGVKDFACGGSLINDRYVLTAAHCLIGRIAQLKGRLINVRLGEHNLNTTDDCELEEVGTHICADPVRDISVDRIIPHPDYLPNYPGQYHDIGLIRLGQTVPLSEYVSPICLPSVPTRIQTGYNLTIAGWGHTVRGKRGDIKQQLSIAMIDLQTCYESYGAIKRLPIEIKETQLCVSGVFERNSCNGDSGGSLMYFTGGSWYAKGVHSYSNVCGFYGFPGVYTKVSEYVAWIHSIVEP